MTTNKITIAVTVALTLWFVSAGALLGMLI